MKVAISARGPELDSLVDVRFGRAPWFIIADTESDEWEAVENKKNMEAAQGAGVQSAECVVGKGAEAVLTGHCGPRAFQALSAAGIKIFVGADGETVAKALDRLKSGDLKETGQADVGGHWM